MSQLSNYNEFRSNQNTSNLFAEDETDHESDHSEFDPNFFDFLDKDPSPSSIPHISGLKLALPAPPTTNKNGIGQTGPIPGPSKTGQNGPIPGTSTGQAGPTPGTSTGAGPGVGGREEDDEGEEEMDLLETYSAYAPSKLKLGHKHPDPVVETASLGSVLPPDINYVLKMPAKVYERKALSALQLEAVIYACQQHQYILPNGERAGYFIGDGAGVGKGRTIAGLICENYLLGRKKSIWVSVSADLKYDAQRDLRDIGARGIKVFALKDLKYAKINSAANGNISEGVLYTTYSSLIGKTTISKAKFRTRMAMIIDWCGEDFDGCIIFDEAHKAKNLVGTNSRKPTKTGEAVEQLQNKLPKARIVYASATGASEPKNMAYMTRLGIWGYETTFLTAKDFYDSVRDKISIMEIVALDLKLRGAYIARQLSFHGVTFKIEEIPIDDEYIKMYDQAVAWWVDAYIKFEDAMDLMREELELMNKKVRVIRAQYWGAHQRFFKYLCIAAKVPRVVELARDAIKNGNCCVIGLQSTGEARTLDQLEKTEELEDFVSTAKGVMQSLIENHFPCPYGYDIPNFGKKKKGGKNVEPASGKRKPVRAAAENATKRNKMNPDVIDLDDPDDTDFDDDESETLSNVSTSTEGIGVVPVKNDSDDSDDSMFDILGEAEQDVPEDDLKPLNATELVVQMRNDLLKRVEELGPKLPTNTLDQLINDLGGPDEVAEMTGRKGRLVATEEGDIVYESRSETDVNLESINMEEKKRFMDGVKKIAIISEAASSGISLQSDKTVPNKLKRIHITLELPWSADRAIQQFGRTHRSNQMTAPEYIFTISELAGEQRFASIVAKRLESLGALTHGDRRAAKSRDLSQFNIDNKYGRQALDITLQSILRERDPTVKIPGESSEDRRAFFDGCTRSLIGVGFFTENISSGYVGITKDDDPKKMAKFLNRLLGIPVKLQNKLFEYFMDTLNDVVTKAKKTGHYDMGILDIGEANEIKVKKLRHFIQRHPTGLSTINIHEVYSEKGMSYEQALEKSLTFKKNYEGFYLSYSSQHHGSGRMAILVMDSSNYGGAPLVIAARPNLGFQNKREYLKELKERYRKVSPEEAKAHWEKQYNFMVDDCFHHFWYGKCTRRDQLDLPCENGVRRKTFHVLSGAILSAWSDIEAIFKEIKDFDPRIRMKVMRVQANGEKIIGIQIENQKLLNLLIDLFQEPYEIKDDEAEPPADVDLDDTPKSQPTSQSKPKIFL